MVKFLVSIYATETMHLNCTEEIEASSEEEAKTILQGMIDDDTFDYGMMKMTDTEVDNVEIYNIIKMGGQNNGYK